jgi:DNA replication protein DnaC
MSKARVMVLDDLGAENVTDHSTSTLYAILSERINNQCVSIVTTNMSLKEINEWDARIASRLAELASIKLPEVDRRITPRQEASSGPGEQEEG